MGPGCHGFTSVRSVADTSGNARERKAGPNKQWKGPVVTCQASENQVFLVREQKEYILGRLDTVRCHVAPHRCHFDILNILEGRDEHVARPDDYPSQVFGSDCQASVSSAFRTSCPKATRA